MTYVFLTQSFYSAYANCPEIEQKKDRPYVRVCVRVMGRLFAIPMRSNINHPHVLWTDKENHCGLDFSKAVILTNPAFIDENRKPYIRPIEFNALRGREHEIEQRMLHYIKQYKKAKRDLSIPRNRTLCQYSTLQYFEQYI